MLEPLATLLDAGVPPARALEVAVTRAPRDLGDRAHRAARAIERGRTLAPAARDAGLIDSLDAALLEAADEVGRSPDVLRSLAQRHARRAERSRRVGQGLLYPALLCAVAILVAPLPQLVSGELTAHAYAARALAAVVAVALGALALRALPDGLEAGAASARGLDALWLRVPLLGAAHARRCAAAWLDTLALLIAAGVAAPRATDLAARAVPNAVVRASFERTAARVAGGARLADALRENPWAPSECQRLVASGEEAGRLPELASRAAQSLDASADAVASGLAAWLPRLVYAAVAFWVASGILRGYSALLP